MEVKQKFVLAKGMHITHLNIRSLWNKIDLIKLFLQKSNISIATLSETWLNEGIPTSLLNIDGYSFERLDRKVEKSCGGVGIYIRSDLMYSNTKYCNHNVMANRLSGLTVCPGAGMAR